MHTTRRKKEPSIFLDFLRKIWPWWLVTMGMAGAVGGPLMFLIAFAVPFVLMGIFAITGEI